MKSRFKKLEIGIFIVAIFIICAVWAVNGYQDTWLYVIAAIIAMPTSWYFFGKKEKDV